MRKLAFLLVFLSSLPLFAAGGERDFPMPDGKKARITVCSDNIFRVRIFRGNAPEESLMERYGIVKSDWAPVNAVISSRGKDVTVSSGTYSLSLDGRTGRFSARKKDGTAVIGRLEFLGGDTPLASRVAEAVDKEFKDLKVSRNSGIIGDTGKRQELTSSDSGEKPQVGMISLSLRDGERLYGGGNTSRSHIQHRGEILRMWSTYQHTESPHPFMLSTGGWAIYNNNTTEQYFDAGAVDPGTFNIYDTSPEADFYLMFGDGIPSLLDAYTQVTGRPYLLPRWAYGLCFGPNMLEDQFDIVRDGAMMRDMGFPCDLLWLEPQWMAKRYDFSTSKTWNFDKFSPEPYWRHEDYPKTEHNQLFIGRLHAMGYHLGLWLCLEYDPSITEEDEIAEREGRKASGQEHWCDHLLNFVDFGVDGFKLDPARTIDEHPGMVYHNNRGDRQMHNLNQVLILKQVSSSFARHTGRRAWLHYCGGWSGSQQWGAMTSGDNGGTIVALFDQLNMGLSGFMNSSCDVMSAPRNIQAQSLHFGTFLPWMQINSWFSMHHPFYFGGEMRKTYLGYARLRAALLPYIYSASLEGAQTGMPIVRALPLEFPDDRKADDLTTEFMFGPSLLVGAFSNEIYLPEGEWIDYWTGERLEGGRTITHQYPSDKAGLLFARGGAILPMCPAPADGSRGAVIDGKQPQSSFDTLTVKIFPCGKSSYVLREDDGTSFAYKDGAWASTAMRCEQAGNKVTFSVEPVQGTYEGMSPMRTYHLQFALSARPSAVTVNGTASDSWTYGQDGFLRVDVPDHDVKSSLEVRLD